MSGRIIEPAEFVAGPVRFWDEERVALVSGDFGVGRFNAMAVGWGSLGMMWRKPFAMVVVRPTRYTHEFMERYDTFTLCVLPKRLRRAVLLLGTKSGRHGDKIAEAGLTPVKSKKIAAPGFKEAELIVECRQIYWDDVCPAHFLDSGIDKNYPKKDYHRIYYGEILSVSGEAVYRVR